MTKLPASLALIIGVLAASAAFAAEKTVTLAVQHMTCVACPGTVKASLQRVPGVTNVVVSAEERLISAGQGVKVNGVYGSTSEQAVRNLQAASGLPVTGELDATSWPALVRYPPATIDFSSMMRAIRAKKPDVVFVASYPSDSTAIIRAVNEIGVGDSVKLFGGGMVGLQYASILESLGSQLNGVVNYHVWAPEKSMDFPGIREFLARYQAKAKQAGVDPLGFYLPPYDYAIGEMLAQAVTATRSLDHKVLAKYIREHEMKTVVGSIRYGPTGEWSNPRMI